MHEENPPLNSLKSCSVIEMINAGWHDLLVVSCPNLNAQTHSIRDCRVCMCNLNLCDTVQFCYGIINASTTAHSNLYLILNHTRLTVIPLGHVSAEQSCCALKSSETPTPVQHRHQSTLHMEKHLHYSHTNEHLMNSFKCSIIIHTRQLNQ